MYPLEHSLPARRPNVPWSCCWFCGVGLRLLSLSFGLPGMLGCPGCGRVYLPMAAWEPMRRVLA